MARPVQKMLYIGDFPVQTGFGVVSTNLIRTFKKIYDLHVLGVNYYGDYSPLIEGLKVYTASSGGEVWGVTRLNEMLTRIQPDVVFVLNDPWICRDYATVFAKYQEDHPEFKGKFIAYTPIDAENIKNEFVEGLQRYNRVVSYTQFGKNQLESRPDGVSLENVAVIPHGVNTQSFFPIMDKKTLKKSMLLGEDDYIVLCLQRNQPRKRIDLTMYYFAEWVKRYNLPANVRFYYHGALQDFGIDILQWAQYLGIEDRLAISSPNIRPDAGLSVDQLNMVYNAADVFFTTTAAEGWCLPVAEAMAVACPVIIPRHSALAEWPEGNAEYMDIYPWPALTDRGLNTIHHVTEMESAIAALHKLYTDKQYRLELGQRGFKHMTQKKFDWDVIARQFVEIIDAELKQKV